MTARQLKIVLLGSIPKGDEEKKKFVDWKSEYIKKIQHRIPEASFLDMETISDKDGPEAVVGHDVWLVKHADILIVHAATKVGAGTAQEMVLAKNFNKPVVSVIPKDSHHRRSEIAFGGETVEEWVHPYLFVSSDFIAENIEEAIEWIKSRMNDNNFKGIDVFDKAVKLFERTKIADGYRKRGW